VSLPSNFHDALANEAPKDLKADVCIVGAGACGITLARKLAGHRGQRVLLLESGPLSFDARTQALYRGDNVGLDYFDLMVCRLRYFGGTTNHWGGFCTPTTRRDFEAAPGVPLAEWPISFEDIEPYMKEAEADLGFIRARCDPGRRLPEEGFEYAGEPDESLETTLYSILDKSKIRFAERFRPELEKLDDLTVLLNTNVVRVQLTPDGRAVRSLRCKTLNGDEFDAKADRYVLACHGIENARLLLASNDINPAGIGNSGDFVGRCFMEHPYVHAGRLKVHNQEAMPKYLNTAKAWPLGFSACLTLSENATSANQCLQYYCRLSLFRTKREELTRRAFHSLYNNRNEPLQWRDLDDLAVMLRDLTGTADTLRDKLDVATEPDEFLLDQRIEQTPNPDSRVLLSEELDSLGSPRARLDWRLSEVDVRTFQVGQEAVSARFGLLNAGRVAAPRFTKGLLEQSVGGHYHHIGTTRMAASPETGVVDRNCRVFGVDNLFVSGSSVFCRSMFSGPTMAMLGFAHRLAEQLRAEASKS